MVLDLDLDLVLILDRYLVVDLGQALWSGCVWAAFNFPPLEDLCEDRLPFWTNHCLAATRSSTEM